MSFCVVNLSKYNFCISFDIGEPQDLHDSNQSELKILQLIRKIHTYLLDEVMVNSRYARIKPLCTNEYSDCTIWAAQGECEENPTFMHFKCPLACRTCDQLEVEVRCPLDYAELDKTNVWKKEGDLDRMFHRIIQDPYYARYEPKILSKPNQIRTDSTDDCSLWVISLEKFLTDEECDRFVEVAAAEGYERSETVDESLLGLDGDYEGATIADRTSENAWCSDICRADPIMLNVMNRIENVTGIPKENQEDFQLLKYEKGQFYKEHTDYITYRADGPRIATFFIYLNDVTSGGETVFTKLGLSVTPKKGKAILYPAVTDFNPMAEDECSEHEALPVIEGIKHAANAWIHMRDYQNSSDDCPTLLLEEESDDESDEE